MIDLTLLVVKEQKLKKNTHLCTHRYLKIMKKKFPQKLIFECHNLTLFCLIFVIFHFASGEWLQICLICVDFSLFHCRKDLHFNILMSVFCYCDSKDCHSCCWYLFIQWFLNSDIVWLCIFWTLNKFSSTSVLIPTFYHAVILRKKTKQDLLPLLNKKLMNWYAKMIVFLFYDYCNLILY